MMMSRELSDHIDSDHFTYNRSWDDIEYMLREAEERQNWHYTQMQTTKNKKKKIVHMRNYKALQGVIKALRWVLGDKNVEHPLD